MEQEIREILEKAVDGDPADAQPIGTFIRSVIEPLGGVDLAPLPREQVRTPPGFVK